MAEVNELSLGMRAFLRLYQWRTIDPIPWSSPRKPLAQANIALVSTAGFVEPNQAEFDDTVKGGDYSFREISSDVDVRTLIDTHRSESFDHTGIRSDQNLAFPLDRLRELQREGVIGRLNHRHWSFMGSITATARLVKETAPAAAQQAVEDGVDAVLLAPV
ncbi:MAG: glycine/sarcosine/betaine reductase selenoprotein B family protein [Thermoanaerobaculia bacterium]